MSGNYDDNIVCPVCGEEVAVYFLGIIFCDNGCEGALPLDPDPNAWEKEREQKWLAAQELSNE